MTATAPAIALRGVSKRFEGPGGELEVLREISFDVPARSILAILGASGCGKSTLLNIISGIARPSAGSIRFGGVPAGEFTGWSAIGYMFQDDRLLPWRTACRNVELALEAGAVPRAERRRRAREALALVGLEEFADAFPYQLSGGMRSRVALARSLVAEPRILLMDEPFSRLDAQTRSFMHGEVLRIQDLKHMTIVFVTHDVEEAAVLADQVVVLTPRPGRVREIVDIPCERPRDPTHPAVAAYIQRLRALI
ncbi:MAG TPA: ABC transporter ATP-binding protein [Burkholderiales bacterium]|nr:ABC transporter ATP-binding protein [Burkholderiales bacterium]